MTTVALIGDGQMGLVLADALVARGATVRIWGPFPEPIELLAKTRQSPRLQGFQLSHEVEVSSDPQTAFEGVDVAINAIPTQYVRKVWGTLCEHVPTATPIASVAKGIEIGTLLMPTQIIKEVVGSTSEVGVLSGPTIATELANRQPAAMVASSTDPSLTKLVQDLFNVPWLRIYTHDDPLGVELAGATKNVIAIAAGICDGIEMVGTSAWLVTSIQSGRISGRSEVVISNSVRNEPIGVVGRETGRNVINFLGEKSGSAFLLFCNLEYAGCTFG